jgi:Lrp/AsnC family leucine-responsive transcriptional regulator
MQLDAIDRKILQILQEEGRITNSELAYRIGLTPTPTMERVRRLERDGFILGYRAVVDPKKVGRGQTVFIQVSLQAHRKDMIESFLAAVADMPEVQECYHTTGASDYMLKVCVRDIEDYEDFVMHKITKAPSFSRIESTIVLSVPKNNPVLSINEETNATH